jgi:hypothetical protein
VGRRIHQGVDDVVLVRELEARVEPEQLRRGGHPQRKCERSRHVVAEHVREPEHGHEHVRVVLGEVAHERLALE